MIELLIAIVVMLIIVGALITAFISHSQTSKAEQARMEVQQNLRVAVDRLSHVLKHAGFGCYDSFEEGYQMTGDDPDGNLSSIDYFIHEANLNSVIIVYGFKEIAQVTDLIYDNGDVTGIELNKSPSPSITTGNEFKRYLSFFPNASGNKFYQVNSVSNNNINFTDSIPITSDYLSNNKDVYVFMVAPARIKINDESSILYLQNFAYTSAQYWTIAEDIEEVQFEYFIPGQGWQEEPSVNELQNQNISKIRFSVWGGTEINGEDILMQSQGEVTLRNAH